MFNDVGLSANPTENQLYNKIFDIMTGSLEFGYLGDAAGVWYI